MSTHEDWVNMREKRDAEARKAVNKLLDGEPGKAMAHAKKWDEYDDAMVRIAKELDGRAGK